MATARGQRGPARAVGFLLVAVVVLLVAVVATFALLRSRGVGAPIPGQQRCVATAAPGSVSLDPEQARLSSIIVGLSVRRGLPPRAASIALATAYQETGIRNLDYGDRDSVGLFQQRPSQGWGTVQQLMDPYYATGEFYDALVKVDGWRTGDINDVAQRVQRSGYPDAYRAHETDARVLASTLSGQTAAGFRCLDRTGTAGDPAGLVKALDRTFGRTSASRDGKVVTVRAKSTELAWAYASFALAHAQVHGLSTAETVGLRWQSDDYNLPEWVPTGSPTDSTTVTLTLR